MINFNNKLKEECRKKNNRLCLGLDIDNNNLKDKSLDYMQDYIIDIINTTIDLCPVYKINFSFYERYGSKGFKILENISQIIDGKAITIADAKRGDIGNSSKFYAEAIFDYLNFDSITVSPYMGIDSIEPFTNYDKGVFVLCLTSNPGSADLQKISDQNGIAMYQHIIRIAHKINNNNNIGLVVGATNIDYLNKIKSISLDLPWLMPGVGFQGGDLQESIKIGENKGLAIINVSRGILTYGKGDINDIRKATEMYTNEIRSVL